MNIKPRALVPLTGVRDFCEARGIRWGGRIAKPQPLAGHRHDNTNYRVHQVGRAKRSPS